MKDVKPIDKEYLDFNDGYYCKKYYMPEEFKQGVANLIQTTTFHMSDHMLDHLHNPDKVHNYDWDVIQKAFGELQRRARKGVLTPFEIRITGHKIDTFSLHVTQNSKQVITLVFTTGRGEVKSAPKIITAYTRVRGVAEIPYYPDKAYIKAPVNQARKNKVTVNEMVKYKKERNLQRKEEENERKLHVFR